MKSKTAVRQHSLLGSLECMTGQCLWSAGRTGTLFQGRGGQRAHALSPDGDIHVTGAGPRGCSRCHITSCRHPSSVLPGLPSQLLCSHEVQPPDRPLPALPLSHSCLRMSHVQKIHARCLMTLHSRPCLRSFPTRSPFANAHPIHCGPSCTASSPTGVVCCSVLAGDCLPDQPEQYPGSDQCSVPC